MSITKLITVQPCTWDLHIGILRVWSEVAVWALGTLGTEDWWTRLMDTSAIDPLWVRLNSANWSSSWIPRINGLKNYVRRIMCFCFLELATVDRRKFRSQTSDNMHRWKAEQGKGREKRKIRREKIRRERVRRKKMQMREKVGKSRNTVFFQWFVAPEGRKVGSLKRRVRSRLARWDMKKCTKHLSVGPLLEVEMSKKCTPLWWEAHFQVKMYKAHHCRTTFGSSDVEKVHAVVARSTFWSQNVQNTPCSDHFWKLRCRKSARRCGAKHILKSKCTKHHMFAPLLEVQMSKKKKVHAVVARSTFRSQNV